MKISHELDLNRLREIIQKNPDSPLFARYADALFQKGLVNESLILIENGLKKHKLYSTAYLVYAKILMSKGRYEEAKSVLNKIFKLSPGCHTAKVLYDQIINKDFKYRIKGEQTEVKTGYFVRRKPNIQKSEIETILEKLENAESLIIKSDPNFNKVYEPPQEVPEVVTETMYHILINQGLYERAYNLLQKLIEKNPSRHEYYHQQLNWLKTRLKQSQNQS